MADREESYSPSETAGASGIGAAGPRSSAGPGTSACNQAETPPTPSQLMEDYLVIRIRMHYLRVLLFAFISVASISGVAFGYFYLPMLFPPPSPFNGTFHDPVVDGARFFLLRHDRNRDGKLDIDEFEPLAFLILESRAIAANYSRPLGAAEEAVKVKAFFEPLQLSTMSKKMNNTNEYLSLAADVAQKFFGFGLLPSLLVGTLPVSPRLTTLQGLFDWKTPNQDTMLIGAADLATAFLPPPALADRLGEPYPLVRFDFAEAQPKEGGHAQQAPIPGSPAAAATAAAEPHAEAVPGDGDKPAGRVHILGNRYYPPRVDTVAAKTLHQLLSMFHPRPFLVTRFPPQGSLGCVRAVNDDYAEVVFRVHAEYQLNEPPLYPFWFTPAQFKGSAVVARNSSSVVDFRLYVPNDRRLNVDMEWMNGPRDRESMEVDIGYMPRMELVIQHEDENGYTPSAANAFTWTKEVQIDMCERNMEVAFYPFKKVPYLNFTEAFAEASRSSKLVHSIVLWGALDDQSC